MPRGKRIKTTNKKKTSKTRRCKQVKKFTGYMANNIFEESYDRKKKQDDDDENINFEITPKKNKYAKYKKAAKIGLATAGGLAALGLGLTAYDKNKDTIDFIWNTGKNSIQRIKNKYGKIYDTYFKKGVDSVIDTTKKYVDNSDFVRSWKNYYADGINDKLDNIQSGMSNNPYDVDISDLKTIIQDMEKQVEGQDEFKVGELKKITKDIITGTTAYKDLVKQMKDGEKTGAHGINNLNNMIWNARKKYNEIMH